MDRKKIAIVSAGFMPIPAVRGGAVEVLANDILDGNELLPQFDIDVYTIPDKELEKYQEKYQHTNIIQVYSRCYLVLKIWNKLRNIGFKLIGKQRLRGVYDYLISEAVSKHTYDYIIIENNMNMYELIAEKKKNQPDKLILHLHNNVNVGDMAKTEELTKIVGKTADRILTVSDYIKNRFLEISPQTKVVTLYNCVDIDKFKPQDAKIRETYRQKYNIQEQDMLVMFSGRIAWEKGLQELVQAFIKLKDNPNIKLMIVGNSWFGKGGSDDYMKEVIQLSEECKDKIIFTGFVHPKDMPKMYAMADIVTIPSIWNEPFGVVVLEAMAMKKPIITTYSGGIPEIVNQNSAVLLDRGEELPKTLASAIKRLAEIPQEREVLAKNAYEQLMAREEFHQAYYFQNFIACLEK